MAEDNDDNTFSCIEPHPYGVLPSGNVFGSSTKITQSPLPGDVWQQVLQYCNGDSLAQVVQTCGDWYVAGHQPELWRDLLLREYGSNVVAFVNCWKDTYVKRRVGKLSHPHQPMTVSRVYSEVYYRTHLCRSFQIPSLWKSFEGGSIKRVTEPITTEEFFTRFEEPNTPVVLAGACKTWKAFQKWKDIEYLDRASMNQTFRATSGAAPMHANFTLKAYHDYCKSMLLEEAPLYLFDRTALSDGTSLQEDYYPDLQRTCPFWNPTAEDSTHDLFQYLGALKRPDHTWLICGPQRSGSSWHVDPNGTHAWNAAICGRKRWLFYPPGVTPPGVYPSSGGEEVAMPISIGEWLLNFYQQEHVHNLRHSPHHSRPLECTVEPGDVIFVPHGWWHAVVNIDDVNIAITHNYVSQSNLATVLRFLEYKEDQISGCRDREESIKPEFLKRAFEEALVKNGFESVLRDAKELAAQGWPCKAWTDDANEIDKQKDTHVNSRKRRRDPSRTSCGNSIMTKAKQHNNTAFSFSFL